MDVRFGYGNNKILDIVQPKFSKYMLGLKSSTPNCMVYEELRCYPASLSIKLRMISFWLKLCSAVDTKLSKLLHDLLYHFYNNKNYSSLWLTHIMQSIQEIGLGHVWQSQGVNYNHCTVKKRCKIQITV